MLDLDVGRQGRHYAARRNFVGPVFHGTLDRNGNK